MIAKQAAIVALCIVVTLIVIARTCTFPLAAGSAQSGIVASIAVRQQTEARQPLAEYPLVAVIVEPRVDNLEKILRSFLVSMPKETHFQVYHGTKNKHVMDLFAEEIKEGRISLWDLGVDNLTIEGYSALLTSEAFWRSMQSERVLIFQTDTITCSQSPVSLEQFAQYDFIGAPTPAHIRGLLRFVFLARGHRLLHTQYYNGGLSYRSRSAMLAVLAAYPWDGITSEDVWFCAFLPKVGGRLPSVEEARKFSFEAERLSGIPWGLHKPRKHYAQLCQVCSEVSEIPFVPSNSDYRSLFLL